MGLLDSFPAGVQAIIVMVVFASVTIAGLFIVRSIIPWEQLRENHEVAGWTFGVVGAFYGVVLAFVIVAAWQRYETATEKAQSEALALADLYNISKGFSDPMRGKMQDAIREYATVVVNNEWQAMADNSYGNDSTAANRLWESLVKYRPTDQQEQLLIDKSMDQMAQLNDARRLRYVYYSEDLPSVVWIVIYVGCVITIGFSYFFGSKHYHAQALMCGTFAALIGLTILAISELSTPYSGAVHVSSEAFESVLTGMTTKGGSGAPSR
ncbi:MAG TPA: DUF4239 domain-containing protein [Candidatus Binataceae bacterium]|nr:DUF4239 domain-containing protein [Candidatus Binataceae bacterium]